MSINVSITQLPNATALTGVEAVPVVQGGVTVQTTTGAISGAGALNYPFLTVGSTAGLTQARYLTTTTGLSLSDTGAGGTLSINMTGAGASLNAAGVGIVVKDGTSTVINRQLTVGSGMTIANANGVADNPLIGVNTNLQNLSSLSGIGLVTVNGSIFTQTTIVGTTNQISIANGNANGGSPTISLADNAILPGAGGVQIPLGGSAQRLPVNGVIRYNTDLAVFEFYQAGAWVALGSGGGGGVTTFSGGATGLTPSSATSGAITLSGILNVANGGSGVNTSTGTGSVVLSISPTLVTPDLGTPSALVGTNITGTASGFTAGHVTTNANLTGPITSVGNATSISSQTGTGTTFVMSISPILTTPNLGTPSTLVATNITGTASGLTAGTVTTNANLTGEATSTGNAVTLTNSAVIGKVLTGYVSGAGVVASTDTILQAIQKLNGNAGGGGSGTVTSVSVVTANGISGTVATATTTPAITLSLTTTGTGTTYVVATSPTLITPALGTPTALVGTNISGTAAGLTAGAATVLATARTIAGVSFDGSTNIAIPLANLSDVTLDTPVVNQILGYNGAAWTNVSGASSGAGAGVVLYNATPVISASGTQNNVQIASLVTIPVVTAEQVVTGTANAASGAFLFSAFVSAALGRTIIDAGVWDFTTWIGVDSTVGSNTVTRQVYTAIPFVTGTVTMTGTGTTRTATASAGTPFATGVIDASATTTIASYLQTPAGLYQITARTSDTVVTIGDVPSTYTNESAVAGTVWKKLFGETSGEITDTSPDYGLYEVAITAGSYAITTATKVGILGFFNSATPVTTHTVSITYNGTTRNTHVSTPLANLHNDLAGLNGGTTNEYYHSTLAEYTGTGTGNFVRASNATLVAPALGTPTALVGTNITGTATAFTSSNVTTNANLTGEATSSGNAVTLTNSAVIGKVLTGYVSGAGTVAATDSILQAIQKLNGNDATNANLTGMVTSVGNATTVVTNANLTGMVTSSGNATTVVTNANLTGPITSVGNATSIASQTGTGTTFVMNTNPILVTPNLGTPSTLVGTNITGTASGLTAGTVTTNANLTGGVTSVGNATTVVTNANLTGEATSTGNAVTLTNSAVIGKVLTGYVSGAGVVAATDTILQAIQKLNGNGGATLGANTFTGSQTISGANQLLGSYGAGGVTTNFAAGDGALASNTTASNNIAIGKNTLATQTSGSNNNIAIGLNALTNNTGSYNVAIGTYSLFSNTSAAYNVAIGHRPLANLTTGAQNTVVGAEALFVCISGDYNSAFGTGALNVALGSNNTSIGWFSLANLTSGINNVGIGSGVVTANAGDNNSIVIGANAVGLGSNTTVLGNTSTTATTVYGNLLLPTAPLGATQGGTGTATYTTGDILYASTTNVLSKLTAGTLNYVLTSGGAGVAPSWAAATGGGGSTAYTEYDFTATASQTTFAVGVAIPLADVYLNGVRLLPTTDYSVSTTNIVLTTGAAVGDILSVLVFVNSAVGGTVTNVAALTLGTTGTDVSSSVATGTTTPVITLNIPTASASNRGALSAADWTTFSGKGTGTVTTVGFTGGIISVATATSTPALTIAGTSGGIPYFSSGTTWATSAALAAGALVQGGGAGVAPSTITTGTGVVTALGVNTGTTGAFAVRGNAEAFSTVAHSAGTTTIAPITLTSGTNLTTAVAGAAEYDGTNLYFTQDTTQGRGVVPTCQQFYLSSAGTAFGATIAPFFGANSAISLDASSTYCIEAFCFFLKTTAGTATWTHTISSAATLAHAIIEYTPITGFTTTTITGAMVTTEATQQTSTALVHTVTGSLTTAVYHIAKFTTRITTNAACNYRLNLTQSAGTVTPQAGSYYKITRVGGTAGNFVA